MSFIIHSIIDKISLILLKRGKRIFDEVRRQKQTRS